jgi:hypothetical protein
LAGPANDGLGILAEYPQGQRIAEDEPLFQDLVRGAMHRCSKRGPAWYSRFHLYRESTPLAEDKPNWYELSLPFQRRDGLDCKGGVPNRTIGPIGCLTDLKELRYHNIAAIMASRAISPKAFICAEKLHLSDLYIEAVREIMQLEDAEISAVINGGVGLERFDLALRVAREKRDRAKLAFTLHLQQHGC